MRALKARPNWAGKSHTFLVVVVLRAALGERAKPSQTPLHGDCDVY